MEMESIFIVMEINSEESFNKESKKVEESICINLELFMMVNGKMIKKLGRERILIQVNKFILVDGSTVKNTVTVSMNT